MTELIRLSISAPVFEVLSLKGNCMTGMVLRISVIRYPVPGRDGIQKPFSGIIHSIKIVTAVISVQPAADRGILPVDFLIGQVEWGTIQDPV